MPQPWQRPLIRSREAECREYLAEAIESGDLDLLEEMAGKMCDVLIVYRRNQRLSPEPTGVTFSDGATRDIDHMAFTHAVAEVFPELDESGEFPVWMSRGERDA